jgi:hypothetical protein
MTNPPDPPPAATSAWTDPTGPTSLVSSPQQDPRDGLEPQAASSSIRPQGAAPTARMCRSPSSSYARRPESILTLVRSS